MNVSHNNIIASHTLVNADLETWQDTYISFNQKVSEFSQKVDSAFDAKVLADFYTDIEEQSQKLKDCAVQIQLLIDQKKQELKPVEADPIKKGRIHRLFTPNRVTIFIVGFLSACVQACVIAGIMMTTFEKGDGTKYSGLVLAVVGAFFSVIFDSYSMKAQLTTDGDLQEANTSNQQKKLEIELVRLNEQLRNLNDEGIRNTDQFTQFIKLLKKIKSYQHTPNPPVVINVGSNNPSTLINQEPITLSQEQEPITPSRHQLDDEISTCLNSYSNLPPIYRREDVYSRILAVLIQCLPTDDPLQKELKNLEHFAIDTSNRQVLETINYLNPYASMQDNLLNSEDKWQNEQSTRMLDSNTYANVSLQTKEEYDKQEQAQLKDLLRYKTMVMNRFNTTRNFKVFTPNGFCCDFSTPLQQSPKSPESPSDSNNLVITDKAPDNSKDFTDSIV